MGNGSDSQDRASLEAASTDRESPVGEPVVRGDSSVTGEHAETAVSFDPDSRDDRQQAVRVLRRFATEADPSDNVSVLRGAAAAAALVRGEGSYRAAAKRAGDGVSVAFVRKWARVHDLPRPIRRAVATGRLAPSAAKHVARLEGQDRLVLAGAILEGDLTVREVRSIASDVRDGADLGAVLAERNVEVPEEPPGE